MSGFKKLRFMSLPFYLNLCRVSLTLVGILFQRSDDRSGLQYFISSETENSKTVDTSDEINILVFDEKFM